MAHWRTSSQDEHPDVSSFIAFSDITPSRYALSFIEEPNERAYNVKVAFIAIDSENLGELVDDRYHTDFGDNKFPYFKGNTNIRIDLEKKYNKDSELQNDDSDSDEDEDNIPPTTPSNEALLNINKFIPPSILDYLCSYENL